MKPSVISQDTLERDPYAAAARLRRNLVDGGHVMLFVVTLGGVVGVVLFNASPRGLFPHAALYRVLNWVVNMGRSLPFLVLMAAIIPFTFWLTGTTIGIPAAVVPMIAAGVPFLAGWWKTRCANCRRRSPPWGSSAAARAGRLSAAPSW